MSEWLITKFRSNSIFIKNPSVFFPSANVGFRERKKFPIHHLTELKDKNSFYVSWNPGLAFAGFNLLNSNRIGLMYYLLHISFIRVLRWKSIILLLFSNSIKSSINQIILLQLFQNLIIFVTFVDAHFSIP